MGLQCPLQLTGIGFNPLLDLSKAPMFFKSYLFHFGAEGKDSYAVYLGINILLIMC